MFRLFGRSSVPFLRTAPVLVAFSVLVLVGSGWSLAAARPERLWGIDFRGGSETQLNFAGQVSIDEVREGVGRVRARLAEALAHVRAESERSAGPPPAAAGEEARAPAEAPAGSGELYSAPEWQAILEAFGRGEISRELAGEFTVQTFQPTGPGVSKEFRVVTSLDETEVRLLKLEDALKAEFGTRLDGRNPIPYTATVGSQVADQMLGKAGMALLFSLVAIFFYIVFRFEFNPAFGLAAIVALCHDTLIALAACVLLEVRIDLTIIAALLTVIGYSLNDTIIVFDRIRENRGAARRPFGEIADESLNQVLGRTVLTSVTTLTALVALLVWGGGVIRGFAIVMTVGVLVGTYSSIFIATPFVALWERLRARGARGARGAGGTASSAGAPARSAG
jgi:preprotein translocase SecF subunit